MVRYWIAVASADHVRRGRTEGFMQVCHGKRAPLERLRPGDGIVTYSPTTRFGEKDGLQSFTALGRLREGPAYQAVRNDGAQAFRRDVDWDPAGEPVPIRPLLGQLAFTGEGPNWGYRFRFGLFSIPAEDFQIIADAMSPGVPARLQA